MKTPSWLPPLPPCSVRPFAPTPCDANTQHPSLELTEIPSLPLLTSTALAYLPLVAKSSLLAAGTKEGKGLNADEVINPSWQARLVKDNGRADGTRLESCCPSSWPVKGSTRLFSVQHKVRSQGSEVWMSLARTSRLDTVFLIHLLWHSFEEYMDKPTTGSVSLHVPLFSLH